MFGIFGKKGKPEKTVRNIPNVLHFNYNEGGFQYACKYLKSEIHAKQTLTAIICNSAHEDDTLCLMLETMNKGKNIYAAYILKIASDDEGFKALGLCYKKTATLRAGDLVFWVPMQRNPAFLMIAPDKRAAWMGGIVAKLAPSYSMKSGNFEILERYA